MGVAVGALIAAPQLLMTATYLEYTPRASLDYTSFVLFSLPLAQLPLVLFPYLFGAGTQLEQGYFGVANFPETCCYVSFLAFVLAIPGLRFRGSIAVFWAMVAIVALVLALGGSISTVAHLVYEIPGFNLFRVPSRHVMEFALAMSVLCAFGVQVMSDLQSSRALRWYTVATMALAAIAVCLSVPSLLVAQSIASHASMTLTPWSMNRAVWLGLRELRLAWLPFARLHCANDIRRMSW